jgi:hypothetical protein
MAIATSPLLTCPAGEKERDTTAMRTILMADPVRYPHMTTQNLRDSFLIGGLIRQAPFNWPTWIWIELWSAWLCLLKVPLRCPQARN